MPDDLDRIAAALAAVVADVDARTVADALWLATATAPPAAAAAPEPEPDAEFNELRDALWLASRLRFDEPPRRPATAPPPEPTAAPTRLSERRVAGPVHRGEPVRVPVPSPLPQAAAMARALRPFTRPWRQGTATQLDVEATVDRYAEHRVLTPVLRPAPERWFDVVVVVDDAPTMAVWRDTVAEFTHMLTRTGFFRAVHQWSLSDTTVKDHLGRTTAVGDATAMTRVPHARRLVLVVSDFAATAWRRPALWRLVSAWARTTPTGLLDPLPVRFWAHSGLDLPTVRATATGLPGPTSTLHYRVPLRAKLTGSSWLPVPALALTPGALERWARTLVRTDPEGCDAVLVPARRRAAVAPASPGPAAEAFLHTASAPAARLALLCAPLERFSLPLLRLLHANAVPEAEPADLAELLVSGLATVDDAHAADPVLSFRPAARDHLLDHVTTDDVWTAHQALTAFIAAHPDVTPTMLALAHTPDGQAALPAELRPFAAATNDTLRLLGVLPDEPGLLSSGTTSVWGAVPPRDPRFLGRKDELERLGRLLAESGSLVAIIPEPLHGLSGVGTSTLAAEYAYRHADAYDIVWWIPAGDELSVRHSLAALADRLGVTGPETMDLRIERLWEHIAAPRRCLLIYDGAGYPDMLRHYLPTGSASALITSYNPAWTEIARTVEVDVFTRAESLVLLRQSWSNTPDEELGGLAGQLADHPLALMLANAFHEETAMMAREYRLRLRELVHLDNDSLTPAHAAVDVALTLSSVSEDHRGLLDLCTYLGDPIAISLLRLDVTDEPATLVEGLARVGLVKYDERRRVVRVHPVVRAVVQATATYGAKSHAQSMLTRVGSGPLIAPHVLPADLFQANDISTREVILDQIKYLRRMGDFPSVRDLADAALQTWQPQAPLDDGLVLLTAQQHAAALRGLGDYRMARDISEATLSRMRAIFTDDEHTKSLERDIALDRRLAGQFESALEVVAGHEESRPECLRLLGQFEEAREIDERLGAAPEDRARNWYGLGDYHRGLDLVPEPSHVRAVLLRKAGEYAEALDLATRVHADCLNRFGKHDERTYTALVSLSNAYRVTGQSSDAVQYAMQAVDGYAEKLGDHPFTSASRVCLALALHADDDRRAVDLAKAAFGDLSRALEDHPHTVSAGATLTLCLIETGQVEEARAIAPQLHQLSTRVLGDEHPDCAALLHNQLLDLELPTHQRTQPWELLEARLGPGHPVVRAAVSDDRLEIDIDLFPPPAFP